MTAPTGPPEPTGGSATLVHWRVTDPDGHVVVHAVTDRIANRMMVAVDGHPVRTFDPIQARALGILLAEATYVGLDSTGPYLAVTRHPLADGPPPSTVD
ncbi:hypothetical protein [Actinocatenispora sera]|uniref:Uncharacterized protein n=1 Tax=Actinocatenispora sera TaxID=390989 RepID=A0A810KVA7_9ACTN|nr:hypothetical protein [Actinocatenispora sera]BCJ26402.1 hypothetical protein Asera_05100 [Actinocatenispora sera]